LTYDLRAGHPSRKNCFYECLICGDVLPSQPEDDIDCKCKNIIIDVSANRLVIEDPLKTRFFCVEERT